MKYLIYKITNIVNNKIYIGCHKTQDVNDGYMGSGKILGYAKEKYGLNNFFKEILYDFETPKDMFEMESKLVNEDFILRNDTYNIALGGNGGFNHINNNEYNFHDPNTWNSESKERHRIGSIKGQLYQKENNKSIYSFSDEERSINGKIGSDVIKVKYPNGTFYKKNHTNEAKELIGKKNSISQKGSKNSQYGTMWITNNEVNKKIKTSDKMPIGFRKGRV